MTRSNKISPQRRPRFFKIFFPQLCGQKLRIPPKFLMHIEDRIPGHVSLKGPSGDTWNAELVRDANGISLQNGWQDFVKDHSISPKDILLFRYDGYSQFTVFIFGKKAWEKEDAFLASSCQEIAIIGDSRAKKKALVCLIDDICDSTPPMGESNKALVIVDTFNVPTAYYDGNRPARCNSMKRKSSNCFAEFESGPKRQFLVVKEEPVEFLEPSTPNKTTDPSDKKKTSTRKRVAEPRCSPGKSIPSVSSTRKKSHPYLVRGKERWCTQSYESGQALIKARMGVLVSNRRPVTEEEMKQAIAAARLFTSKNPTALVVMRESFVHHGFYLNLPTSFVREYLPKSTQEMKLLDPNGKLWTVNYIVHLGHGGISARWGAFSFANNLETGDVCVFELIAKAAMKVHIFRVVDELTPLTHVPSQFEELRPFLMLEDKGNISKMGH